jgi:nucleoside-triphosphatase
MYSRFVLSFTLKKTVMKKNIILTGLPRSGKSTMIKKIVENKWIYGDRTSTGLFTDEILDEKMERIGFKMGYFDDFSEIIAHKYFPLPKVGKYGVEVKAIDKTCDLYLEGNHLNSIVASNVDFYFLDEIGEMQLMSRRFKDLLSLFLNSEKPTITTMTSVFEDATTRIIKRRKDVIFIEIKPENRKEKTYLASKLLSKIKKAQEYTKEKKIWSVKKRVVYLESSSGLREIYKNQCSCGFFEDHKICSHVIAGEVLFPDLVKLGKSF